MNPIVIFLLGYVIGTILTFFLIMLIAQKMEKGQKEVLIKQGQAKVK